MHNQIKRKLGLALFIFGLTIIGVLLAMFLWIVVDAFYRTGDLSFLSRKDFYYSLPLFLFLLPGIYLTSAGRRMSQGEELSRLSYVEISLMLIIGIGLIYLNLQADSNYAERANQKQNGH